MGAMDYLSSLHWLDLLSALITLAAEFVAIFYLDEEAHSAFWFMFLLTAMPPLTAVTGAIARARPCKWDDMVVAIAEAVLMNTCFAYFCSGSLPADPVTGEQPMGFGELPIVPLVFFSIAGGVQVLIAIILYAMEKPCSKDSGDETDTAANAMQGCRQFCIGGVMPAVQGLFMMLFQLYTPWHPLRGDWYGYVFVAVMWITDVGSADAVEKTARKLKDEETPPSLMAIINILGLPLAQVAALVANAMALSMAADLVYVVPPCQYPKEYWAGTYTGNFTLTGDADGLLPNKDNCTLDNGFGWDDIYGNRTPAERLYVDEVGFDIGIGPYSPFSTFSDGQGLQMYDFVMREVYEANYEAWTTDRTYPRQYFFNDHPNAGARSFDYVYSLIGVVTGAFYACMLVCLVPMQLKALCSGGDPSGGIQAEI